MHHNTRPGQIVLFQYTRPGHDGLYRVGEVESSTDRVLTLRVNGGFRSYQWEHIRDFSTN